MKRYLILTLCLLCWSSNVFSQSKAELRKQSLQNILREKIHVDLDALKAALHSCGPIANLKSGPNSKPLGANLPLGLLEADISSDPAAESEIHAAINPTDSNNIVVSAMKQDPSNLFSSLLMPIYYTKDFGKTWKKSSFNTAPYESDALVLGGGDPVFAYDANGKVYISWIDLYLKGGKFDTIYSGMYWASSTNGGQTWTRSTDGYIGRTAGAVSDPEFGINDKQWLTVDRTNSSHRNTLYTAFTYVSQSQYGVRVRRKLPDHESMEEEVVVSDPNFAMVQFTSIGVDASGSLHVTFMGNKDGNGLALYHSVSTDGGLIFSEPRKITDIDVPNMSPDAKADTITGIIASRDYPCPHLAIDTGRTGDLYIVWSACGTTSNLGNGTCVYYCHSTDNGNTWTQPAVINNDQVTTFTDHFYPSIAINGNGVVTVTWYDRRGDTENDRTNYYMAQSFDRGATWSNRSITTAPMRFSQVGAVNGGFGVGEYTQVITTANYAIPFWADGRNDDGNLDIYASFIPIVQENSSVPVRTTTLTSGASMLDNYPNPFSTSTVLSYWIDNSSNVQFQITNALGERVRTIWLGLEKAGRHEATLVAGDLPSGTYYCTLVTDSGFSTAPITIRK